MEVYVISIIKNNIQDVISVFVDKDRAEKHYLAQCEMVRKLTDEEKEDALDEGYFEYDTTFISINSTIVIKGKG